MRRLRKQRRQLCFWTETLCHSFALNLPPQPPFWRPLDQFLAKVYPQHVRFEDLPQPPRSELIAIPPPPRDPRANPAEEELEETHYHVTP